MQYSDDPLADRLRLYCLKKPGAEETFTFGETKPAYRLLGGFLLNFAQFYLKETPICLLLRCEDECLKSMQAAYLDKIALSPQMKWETSVWKWVDVCLDGSIPETILHQLIDFSYNSVFSELNEHDKKMIALSEHNLTAQQALGDLLDIHDLNHCEPQIRDILRPAIFLRTSAVDERNLQLGQSKIGGVPDLPEYSDWPTFDDKPLAFLAQVNLSEIPRNIERELLPETGILYFFSVFGWQQDDGDLHPDLEWDRSNEEEFSQVLFLANARLPLRRCNKPNGIRTFNAAAVEYLSTLSLPRASAYCRDPCVADLEWTEQEYDRLDNFYFDFNLINDKALGHPGEHQLLGYADAIQNAVTQPDTRLLFQVASDYYNAGMEWGDGGIIYFIIRQGDLERQDFSTITSDFQCG
ncbi:MAG: DUF1963 domain-containing protein [Anaerolineae bacterium]|nr:DUF1963 domain-containing protein [Anaerolineae bacterium]